MASYTIQATNKTEAASYTAASAMTVAVSNPGGTPMVIMQASSLPADTAAGVPLASGETIQYPMAASNNLYVRGMAGAVVVINP